MKNRALVLISAVLILTGCSPSTATTTGPTGTSISRTTALSSSLPVTTSSSTLGATTPSTSAQSKAPALEPYVFSMNKVFDLPTQEITIFDLYVDKSSLAEDQVVLVYSIKTLVTKLPSNAHSVSIDMVQHDQGLGTGSFSNFDTIIADAGSQNRKLLPGATLMQLKSFVAIDQSDLKITFSEGNGEIHGEFTAPFPQEDLDLKRLSPALLKVRTDLAGQWQVQHPMKDEPSLIDKPTLFGKNIELTVTEVRFGEVKFAQTAGSRPGVFLLYNLKGLAKVIKPSLVEVEAYQDGVQLSEVKYADIEGYASRLPNYAADIKSDESLDLSTGFELLTDSPVQIMIYSNYGNVRIEDAFVIFAKP